MPYPHYSYPPSVIFGLAASVLFGGRRSFRADGHACLDRLQPPLRIIGKENTPRIGPVIITFNHYYRPGFNAWWMALALAAAIPADIHFVMTGELTFPGKWYAPFGMAGSRWLLKRIARIYGFTTMPPMPPRPKDVEARSRSVRKTLAFVRQHPQAILGLAPEGGDQPGGLLNWPATGAGRFISLLACPACASAGSTGGRGRSAGSGPRILPVGTYEEDGVLYLKFGDAYALEVPEKLSADEKDRAVAEIIMRAIARELPIRLRGQFN